MLRNGFAQQQNQIFGLLAEHSMEGAIFVSADPLALWFGCITTSRAIRQQTAAIATAPSVQQRCDPKEPKASEIRRIVDQRGMEPGI